MLVHLHICLHSKKESNYSYGWIGFVQDVNSFVKSKIRLYVWAMKYDSNDSAYELIALIVSFKAGIAE